MAEENRVDAHTLVIGSGIAGLNFALNAAPYGKVLLITKKKVAESSTNRAQGGIAAVLDKADQFEQHVQDTLEAGAHHNERDAVEFMVKHGPEAVRRLVEFGVPFATDDQGKILLTREGGHQKRRIAFVGDYTGQEIERALVQQIKQHPNIELWEHTFAARLFVKDGVCYGVRAIQDERLIDLLAANTVIATGGTGQVFQYTTNPSISTGDGIAMGIEAGLKVRDMEFIQFHPTAFKDESRTKFLLTEALRGEGAYLVNGRGERFMKEQHPQAELAPRDTVARAVYQADLNGGAYLDISHEKAETLMVRFPQIYQNLKKHGYDLTQDRIPVAPAAHYSCGGLVINRYGQTDLQNLYAFGEVSWTGVHGANRLASNSLLEALVFSNQILPQLKEPKPTPPPDFEPQTYKKPSDALKRSLQKIRESLRHTMWKHVGILRNSEGLRTALDEIERLQSEVQDQSPTPLNIPLRETQNMLMTAHAITQAAFHRKTSLGSHHIEN